VRASPGRSRNAELLLQKEGDAAGTRFVLFDVPPRAWVQDEVVTVLLCFFDLLKGVAFMPQGTIKKVIADKGFGFIAGEHGELFFHHSALEGTAIEVLRVGQKVSYEEGRGPKGPRAEKVRPE
jgi:CspA family cold shock protein